MGTVLDVSVTSNCFYICHIISFQFTEYSSNYNHHYNFNNSDSLDIFRSKRLNFAKHYAKVFFLTIPNSIN